MNLPTLYSRTSTGAIQTWTIEVEGDRYRTISGLTDGKKVETKWTTVKGKNAGRSNETTGAEQALSEAQSKWDKRAKTGYTPDIDKIDQCTSFVEVMLAKQADDYLEDIDFSKGDWVWQTKLNGVRCVARLENDRVVLRSRSGEEWVSVPHINRALVPVFQANPDLVLDGELFNNDLRQKLNELISLVRQQDPTPEGIKRSEEIVQYHVYDGYWTNTPGFNETAEYMVRKVRIDKIIVGGNFIKSVHSTWFNSRELLEKAFGDAIADGQEGLILRNIHGPYEHKRSKHLLKYKPEDDDEGVILSLVEGTKGSNEGTARNAIVGWKGKEFEAVFKGDLETRRHIWQNPNEWIGKTVTFLYTGLTGKGTPNYGRIDPQNCMKGDR